jgi:hypothetical protein
VGRFSQFCWNRIAQLFIGKPFFFHKAIFFYFFYSCSWAKVKKLWSSVSSRRMGRFSKYLQIRMSDALSLHGKKLEKFEKWILKIKVLKIGPKKITKLIGWDNFLSCKWFFISKWVAIMPLFNFGKIEIFSKSKKNHDFWHPHELCGICI